MKIELKVKNVCSHSHFPKLIQWDGLESLPGSSVPWALCLTPMTLAILTNHKLLKPSIWKRSRVLKMLFKCS